MSMSGFHPMVGLRQLGYSPVNLATAAAAPACSYGAFWMSLAIYVTLLSGKVFTDDPTKGERLMLTLWGILVGGCLPPPP
jgi:succinate-acetate transporter protein